MKHAFSFAQNKPFPPERYIQHAFTDNRLEKNIAVYTLVFNTCALTLGKEGRSKVQYGYDV